MFTLLKGVSFFLSRFEAAAAARMRDTDNVSSCLQQDEVRKMARTFVKFWAAQRQQGKIISRLFFAFV